MNKNILTEFISLPEEKKKILAEHYKEFPRVIAIEYASGIATLDYLESGLYPYEIISDDEYIEIREKIFNSVLYSGELQSHEDTIKIVLDIYLSYLSEEELFAFNTIFSVVPCC